MRDLGLRLNFSWVEEGVIAGAHHVSGASDLDFLREKGIKVIINLMVHHPYDQYPLEARKGFTIYHLPIENFGIASELQVIKFWEVCRNHEKLGEPIVVHCLAGCGRTGTMLAIWLLLSGKVQTSQESIEKIRQLRPCSIEREVQEEFVHHMGTKLDTFHSVS